MGWTCFDFATHSRDAVSRVYYVERADIHVSSRTRRRRRLRGSHVFSRAIMNRTNFRSVSFLFSSSLRNGKIDATIIHPFSNVHRCDGMTKRGSGRFKWIPVRNSFHRRVTFLWLVVYFSFFLHRSSSNEPNFQPSKYFNIHHLSLYLSWKEWIL